MKPRTSGNVRRLVAAAIAPLIALAAPASALAAAANEPAKGAPIGDVIWGTAVAGLVTAAVLWVCAAHRAGRIQWLGRLAGRAERVSGMPGWVALPALLTGVSLLVAGFGFYWDVAKHIDTGRDPSPFGTPAHYPILIGLFGIAVSGLLGVVLGTDRRTPTAVRIAHDWYAPLGAVLVLLCGVCALTGFPLDDVWHTLFGQDVTLWGPTHVLMIAGASLSTVGIWVLLVEGRRAAGTAEAPAGRDSLIMQIRTLGAAGGFLIGLSTLQGEFDYGVPQFQLVYQPIMIMFAAGVGLVTARVRLGRGGALKAVAFFLVVRGLWSLIIAEGFGLSTLHFPLYLAEALIVEAVALRITAQRPITLGAVSGALIGTIGLAAEWGWSHLWMPLPWPSSLLDQAIPLGFAAAVAGGIIGGYMGRALTADAGVRQTAPRWLLPAAAAVAVFCIFFPLPMNGGSPVRATIATHTITPGPQRTVAATVKLDPADAAKGADWLTVTAWQGGSLVLDRLQRVGPGTYRTTEPIPVYGKWKAMVRMAHGRTVVAAPIYLPEDKAIPAKEVPARPQVTREFVRDKKILQRESVGGAAWLWGPAYAVLLGIAAAWLAALTWGLRRLELTSERAVHERDIAPPRAPARPVVGAA